MSGACPWAIGAACAARCSMHDAGLIGGNVGFLTLRDIRFFWSVYLLDVCLPMGMILSRPVQIFYFGGTVF